VTWKNGQCRVVKTDVTCPFCIRHHIGVYLDVSIAFITFIKMDARKYWVTLRLPLSWLTVKNGFQSPILQQPKFFYHWTCGDRKFSIAIFLVCHCGLAIYMKKYLKGKEKLWKFQYFTMQKYNFKKNNSLKETKLLQDITTLSLIPSFNISQNIIFQKSSHKNKNTT